MRLTLFPLFFPVAVCLVISIYIPCLRNIFTTAQDAGKQKCARSLWVLEAGDYECRECILAAFLCSTALHVPAFTLCLNKDSGDIFVTIGFHLLHLRRFRESCIASHFSQVTEFWWMVMSICFLKVIHFTWGAAPQYIGLAEQTYSHCALLSCIITLYINNYSSPKKAVARWWTEPSYVHALRERVAIGEDSFWFIRRSTVGAIDQHCHHWIPRSRGRLQPNHSMTTALLVRDR